MQVFCLGDNVVKLNSKLRLYSLEESLITPASWRESFGMLQLCWTGERLFHDLMNHKSPHHHFGTLGSVLTFPTGRLKLTKYFHRSWGSLHNVQDVSMRSDRELPATQ